MNTNLTVHWIMLSVVVLGWLGWAAGADRATTNPTTAVSEVVQTPALRRLFPEDRTAIDREVQRKEYVAALRSALGLIDHTHDRIVSSNKEAQAVREAAEAFQEAWALACHLAKLAKQSNMQEADELFQSKWDSMLIDGKTVSLQLGSLNSLCAPRLTDSFWESAHAVKDKTTLSAYAYAIYNYGNAQDLSRAAQWRSETRDRDMQDILDNAISYLRHRLSGNPTELGPAARPPTRPAP